MPKPCRCQEVSGPLVAVLDGPMIGQWFTLKDWRARLESAIRMHYVHGQFPAMILFYEPAGFRVLHPHGHADLWGDGYRLVRS